MDITKVTSKGQVTIPQAVRRKLGIRKGSRVEFTIVGDRVELHLVSTPAERVESGFGMLESGKPAVAADFDPVVLLRKEASGP